MEVPRASSMGPLDQAGRQPAGAPQPPLDALHSAAVTWRVVVVAEEVQEPVKRENAQLLLNGMLGRSRLPCRHS